MTAKENKTRKRVGVEVRPFAKRWQCSERAVQLWNATGTLPKNSLIRAAYIKAMNATKPKGRKPVAK